MMSGSSVAQAGQCPCGLPYEDVRDLRLVGAGGVCTAVWANASGNVCGMPLGAHPHTQAVTTPDIKNNLQATWNAIVNYGVTKNRETRLWKLRGKVRWVGKVRKLYNRECYDDLLFKMNGKDTVLIKGTPGIGKTLFLMAMLVSFVEKAQQANLVIPTIDYLRLEGGRICHYRLLSDGRVQIYDLATHGLPDYLLSDSVDLNIANGKLLSLEVTSDDKINYKDFEKRVQEASDGHRGLRTHMPLFSLKELLCIRHDDICEEEAKFRYEVFGGSARNFMDRDLEEGVERLEVVDQTMEWMFGEKLKAEHQDWWNSVVNKICEKLTQNDRALDKNTINSLMRHRLATKPIWASKFMEILAGMILETKELDIHTALEELIGRSGMGVIFESVGHKKISTCSDNYPLQPLYNTTEKKSRRPEEMFMRFDYPIRLIRKVADLSQLPQNSYGLPIHGYFTLADFVVKTEKVTVIGNFTIAETHGGTLEQLQEILQHIQPPDSHRVIMVWVVPRKTLDTFKWVKGLESIDQYVMTHEPASLKRKANTGPKKERAAKRLRK